MSKVLGIDLGTTISKMATIKDGEPKCIPNREGSILTPSVVAISKNGERLIGILAKRQAITNPENTIFAVKRFIGRRYDDPEVQEELRRLPYQTRKRKDGGVEIKMGDKWYTPVEISAMILQKLKLDAQEHLGEEIKDVVITCPANFDDSQRKATRLAGEIAGFNVLRIINEPTAAALAYGLGKKEPQKVLVYDFGGGTFDVTILEVSPDTVEVLATGGEAHLGGKDFDQRIVQWIIDEFKKQEGIDLSQDPLALQRLHEAAETAKIELSTAQETEINLPFISSTPEGPKHLYYKLTRAQFQQMTRDLIDRSIERVKKTLEEAKLKKDDIDEIVLVGGTTFIPAVREAVKEFFGKEPNKSLNPEEVVAMGAAIQAEILKAKEEGRAPEGEIKSVLLLDVLPLSLGIETLGGVNTIMIPKNTTIPTKKSEIFSTATDNQTSVEIRVLQGERAMAKDNRLLGTFILDGIPPAPRGVPKIEVTFDVDANGIITVSAKDLGTGKSKEIRIEGSLNISKEEIEKMKQEAERFAQEDQKKRELAELRNQADSVIYTAQKTLQELKDKISEADRKEIEEKIKELEEAGKSEDAEKIKTKLTELSSALQKVGAKLYGQDSSAGSSGVAGENKEEGQEKPEEPEEGETEPAS